MKRMNKEMNEEPKRSQEKMAIAEYLLLLMGATAEIENRKYCRKEFWDALAKTTVDLKPTVTVASKRKEDNLCVDKVAAELYNTVSGAGEDMCQGNSRKRVSVTIES